MGGQGPRAEARPRAACAPPVPAPLPREMLHLPGPAAHSRCLSSSEVCSQLGSCRSLERPLAAPTTPSARAISHGTSTPSPGISLDPEDISVGCLRI